MGGPVARNVLIGTVLLLCCGSPAAPQSNGCVTIPNSAKIAEVGAFSNMRYTDEHADGYTLMLWRAGDCLFGLFESSQGLAGDTPVGELQGVRVEVHHPVHDALSDSRRRFGPRRDHVYLSTQAQNDDAVVLLHDRKSWIRVEPDGVPCLVGAWESWWEVGGAHLDRRGPAAQRRRGESRPRADPSQQRV